MLEGAIMTTAIVVLFRVAYLWLKRVHAGNVANEAEMRRREADAERVWHEMQTNNRETQEWAAWYESTKRGDKIVLRLGNTDASFND